MIALRDGGLAGVETVNAPAYHMAARKLLLDPPAAADLDATG